MKPQGVTISIARDPALVRTVRLVAAAVARRAGHSEDTVEEVRLAVGEACALMVGPDAVLDDLDDAEATGEPVVVTLNIADRFRVEVTGEPSEGAPAAMQAAGVDPWALLRGLNEGMSVVRAGSATAVSMSWPLG